MLFARKTASVRFVRADKLNAAFWLFYPNFAADLKPVRLAGLVLKSEL